MKRLWTGLALLACICTANAAGGRAEVRKHAETSMLVTGSILIEKDGSVGAHSLDQPDKLPPVVVELVGKGLARWRFEPIVVDGKSVRGRAKMSVRVIAKQSDDGNYQLRIGSATFGESSVKGQTVTSREKLTPPRYPEAAYYGGIQGTALLILKIGEQGQVEDVIDEQVNLTVVGTERQMEQGRKLLADAAKKAAWKWKFDVPTEGEAADDPYWTVRVPVSFDLCDDRARCPKAGKDRYGSWEGYIPGPRNAAPWATGEDPRQSSDALADGTVHLVGSGPKLLTRLGDG